jgi:acetylornithine/succinyldiaminopimelate/putrescine aminotransferase
VPQDWVGYLWGMHTRQLFLQHLAQTSPSPLMIEIERAEGIFMYSPEGKAYIDLISGISVSNLGHRHPAVLSAIQHQLDKYLHLMVYGELVQAPQVQLAEALSHTLPEHLNTTYFVNSGSEAIEGAMKLAKRFTGRSGFVSFENAYHGSSHGALSLMGNEYFKEGYGPFLPHISHVAHNSKESIESITEKTAAVVLETVQGEAGVHIPNPEWIQSIALKCKQMGALLILDEIQCGFGRTGTFWAFEQFGIVPDILVTAKGMGGGMPIGAFISSTEIMQCLSHHPVLGHITTFGGHPVCCAASLATLNEILKEEWHTQAITKGLIFRERLKHPAIKEFRGIGLLMALDLGSDQVVQEVIAKALEKGLFTDWFLFNAGSLRLAPPLTITEEQIHAVCDMLLECL